MKMFFVIMIFIAVWAGCASSGALGFMLGCVPAYVIALLVAEIIA